MTQLDEAQRLRRLAADLVEQSERRDQPLSPEEDGQILTLLQQARDLERQALKKHIAAPAGSGSFSGPSLRWN